MTNTDELRSILAEMSDVLRSSEQETWAESFRALVRRIEGAPTPAEVQDLARDIKSLFGGMGSLTDIVLYRNGSLSSENDRFDDLRRRLFAKALDLIQ